MASTSEVIVVIGAGSIGQAIARRVSTGKHVVLADLRIENAEELCPAGRAGAPDEIGALGAFLMGPEGAFITGSDFLIDGGVTAAYFYGNLAPTSDNQDAPY
jgi:NAD(P)-dependent dehydrogenase (short-subunit alcohol dehydrogenase family)